MKHVHYALVSLHFVIFHIIGLPQWLGGKESACKAGDAGWTLSRKDPLEKGMATPSGILA